MAFIFPLKVINYLGCIIAGWLEINFVRSKFNFDKFEEVKWNDEKKSKLVGELN